MIFVVGVDRTLLLNSLSCDQRCEVFIKSSILENLRDVRIIKPQEIDEIETLLLPHQKVKINYGNFLQYHIKCIFIIFKH